jgi:hypothetical protein
MQDSKNDEIVLVALKYQTFENYTTDLTKLQNYINIRFGVDVNLSVHFILNKNFLFDGGSIDATIQNTQQNGFVLSINIHNRILYDPDIFDKNKIKTKTTYTRNKYEYIHNPELQVIIKNLFNEIKTYVSANRKKKTVISYKHPHPNAIIIKSAFLEFDRTEDEFNNLMMEYRNHYGVNNREFCEKIISIHKLKLRNCYLRTPKYIEK